jgi:hypothetical protein
MSNNHGISTQILQGPLAISPLYPALVVDKTGKEVCLCGLSGDQSQGGPAIAAMFVRLFNETDIDLSAPAEVVEAEPAATVPTDEHDETAVEPTKAP